MNSPLQKFSWVLCLVGIFATGRAAARCCPCDASDGCGDNQELVGHDPYTGQPQCSSCGNISCNYCDCIATYTDSCPSGVAGNLACLEVSAECPGDCKKYKLCNKTTGADAGYVVSPECHMESEICYANRRNCNLFGVDAFDWGDDWNGSQEPDERITCLQSEQTGEAEWRNGGWDIANCKCKHTGFIWAKSCSGVYLLKPRYITLSSVNGLIEYATAPEHYYCSSCSAGLCPGTITGQESSNQCYNIDFTSTSFVVCSCNSVASGYYAQGTFMIEYPLRNSTLSCAQACGDGLTTNGAIGSTSSDACVPDSTEYCDDTGCFTLGGDASLCR